MCMRLDLRPWLGHDSPLYCENLQYAGDIGGLSGLMTTPLNPNSTLGEYDYVIVGAGSAGCTLANRLTANPAIRVCLLEAGGRDTNPLIHAPIGFAFMQPGAKENWSFETVPQKHLNGRKGYQPRGRVIGGSSSINAMIYIRGFKSDYDNWAASGAQGWAWDDVLPYFLRAENNERGKSKFHNVGGPLNVADLRYKNPLSERFLDAARALQLPVVDDFNQPRLNTPSGEGFGYYQVTQKDGRRFSAAKAYLEPIHERDNLRVITNAHAEKIVFSEGRATGVKFSQDGQSHTIHANGEIIISAGALQSPHLLMLSGIGPASHLNEHTISVRYDNTNVGSHLQDHLDYCLMRKSRSPHTIGLNFSTLARALPNLQHFRKTGTGPFTSNLAESGAYVKTDPNEAEPDIQLHFLPALVDDHGRKKHFGGGFSCHSCVLRPKSRGTVRLSNNDPHAAPLIDPNFLSHEDDLTRLVKSARLVERIFNTPALKEVSETQMYLAHDADEAALIDDIRNRADTIYHPVGTCRMGHQDDSVVDPHLRVRGVSSLRIVDASVMPALISGNTNAPSIMIAEKAADLILANGR